MPAPEKPRPYRSLSKNSRAYHRYVVLEELECGLALRGTEVKSLRAGGASIAEAFGVIKQGEFWLVGATIAEYAQGNIHNHAPARERKLLCHKRELLAWTRKVREKGVTTVPLELYFQGHLVKVRMGLVRGKKLYDKREQQKTRSARRDMDRAMKHDRR